MSTRLAATDRPRSSSIQCLPLMAVPPMSLAACHRSLSQSDPGVPWITTSQGPKLPRTEHAADTRGSRVSEEATSMLASAACAAASCASCCASAACGSHAARAQRDHRVAAKRSMRWSAITVQGLGCCSDHDEGLPLAGRLDDSRSGPSSMRRRRARRTDDFATTSAIQVRPRCAWA